MFFCCQTQKFWERLCEALGRPEWIKDERFLTVEDRRENRAQVEEAVESVLKTDTMDNWMKIFGGKVPAAPVYDVAQALDNPYAHAVEMVYEDHHPEMDKPIRLMSSPYRFNGKRLKGGIAPVLGADTDDLLG